MEGSTRGKRPQRYFALLMNEEDEMGRDAVLTRDLDLIYGMRYRRKMNDTNSEIDIVQLIYLYAAGLSLL